ncbi:MAG: DUF362 domain-containing protein [Acidobacteriota bacterium]
MDRREFLHLAATPWLLRSEPALPAYRVVTPFRSSANPGMPGAYRGQVVRVRATSSIDEETEKVDPAVVRRMISTGMRKLTGAMDDQKAWSTFFSPEDVVGIKVNCSGAPNIMSSPEVVASIVSNLLAVGVPPNRVYIYERFQGQLNSVGYGNHVHRGVNILAVETQRGSILGYDPRVYVEVDFFGEDDTRSNLVRLVSETLTKIINVPNMKEHQAAGVTGCLKNIAYGNFSNVGRSHRWEKTNTYSFIGTLAAVEPLPSKTVLHIMDGLRGVWHAGPFSEHRRFRFFPKEILFGTDPVAMDRLLIDVIEEKRKREKAPSLMDRSRERVQFEGEPDPSVNRFIREPGHVEYASRLGLGTCDLQQIRVQNFQL